VRLVPDLLGVVAQIDAGTLAGVAIDIPIGLAEDGARRADVEARQWLGPRRSSVFPAPVRSVLTATTYDEACSLSRATCGKAISKQLFNILPKIREVDALVTPQRQQRLFEMSPELSLAVLAGAPMTHPKTTPAGRAERIDALGRVFNAEEIERHLTTAPRGARRDDILDAFAGAWTARRHVAARHLQLGGDLDAHGLRMEVIA
jgi:predicted RNase H-like nuclease